MQREEFPEITQKVLWALTTSRTTTTCVTLAADMWNPSKRSEMGGDPVGLVEYILASLNELGLVTYRIDDNEVHKSVGDHYFGLPHTIRLSQDGWALMGYPNRTYEVGSPAARRRHTHGPDKTNYRNHSDHAIGGHIEVDTRAEHQVLFPHHVHMWKSEQEIDVMTRGYVKVTNELEMHVLAIRARYPAASNEEIAETAEVPIRTVKYILTELPRLRRLKNGEDQASASLKQRILWALQEGEFPDVTALRLVLGRADTDHDIVHVLHSLHKDGIIDFTEKGAAKTPIRIHIRQRANKPVLKVVASPETGETQPEEEPVAAALVTATAQLDPGERAYPFPQLAALREREEQRRTQDQRGLRFLEAAELLKDTDPETAEILIKKASENDVPYPSPLEQEYLMFAAEFEIE